MPNNPPYQPTPVPVPTPTPYNLPNIPANAYNLLIQLADAIDTANSKLNGHASKLSDIHTSTNNAVNEVTTTSKGQATDTLAHLWGDSQNDLTHAHDKLTAITTSKDGIGPGPNDFRSTLDANKNGIQNGLIALAALQQQQSYSTPTVSPQQLAQWKQDIDTLDSSIANVNMALQVITMTITTLNDGFSNVCATGLIPGKPIPAFNQNAFAHQANSSAPGSGSGKITEQELANDIQTKGGSEDASLLIPTLAEDRFISLDSIKALLDTGVNPDEIYTWLMNDNGYQITNDTIKETTANVNLLVSRGGDATESATWLRGLDADQLTVMKNRASQSPNISATNLKDLVDPPKLEYDPNPKHDAIRPGVGPQPTNGQAALNNSVAYKSTTFSRVSIDPLTEEIVVLDDTNNGKYHGHVETWKQLDSDQQNALKNCGFIDSRGRIIIRDRQGNIKGYGRNVEKEK